MQLLLDAIHHLTPLSAEEKAQISKAFVSLTLKKNEHWISEGNYCRHIAFVNTGKLRVYYNNEEGNETTCFFVGPNGFISSFSSFLLHVPTTENIVALEETEILTIDRDALEALSQQVPKMQIVRRIIAENLFVYMEKRVATLQAKTASERYDGFMKENADLLLSVPLQRTASYLGITPQHLSRLRKEQQK